MFSSNFTLRIYVTFQIQQIKAPSPGWACSNLDKKTTISEQHLNQNALNGELEIYYISLYNPIWIMNVLLSSVAGFSCLVALQ